MLGKALRPSEILAATAFDPDKDSLATGVNVASPFASKGLTCDSVVVSSLVSRLLSNDPVVDMDEGRGRF